jgi:foldase protein PrsA
MNKRRRSDHFFKSNLFAVAVSILFVFLFGLQGPLHAEKEKMDAAQKKAPSADPEIVATVNGEKITRAELETRMAQFATMMKPETVEKMDEQQRRAFMQQVLERIIETKLTVQEAVKEGIQVTDEEAGRMLKEFRRRFSSDEEMEAILKKGKTSIEMRKKDDRGAVMTRKLEGRLVKQLPVSNHDLQTYFETNRQFLLHDMVKAKHIMVETQQQAREVLARLKKGESFEALAKQFSIDSDTKDKGGEVGWFHKGGMLKEYGDAAFALKVGEVSPPVETKVGYFLVKVEAKKKKEDQTFEDHLDHIRLNIQQQQWSTSKRSEWIASLKAKAKITNKLAP